MTGYRVLYIIMPDTALTHAKSLLHRTCCFAYINLHVMRILTGKLLSDLQCLKQWVLHVLTVGKVSTWIIAINKSVCLGLTLT